MTPLLNTLNDYSPLISLILSAVATLIAIVSLIRTKKSEIIMKQRIIFEKESEIYAIEQMYFSNTSTMLNLPDRNKMQVRMECLKAQVKYLKEQG